MSKIKTLCAISLADIRTHYSIATWLLACSAVFVLHSIEVLGVAEAAVFIGLAAVNTWLIWTNDRFLKRQMAQTSR